MSTGALRINLHIYMNRTLGVVIGILVILGGVYLIIRNNSNSTDDANSLTGRVVFSVTDAAVNLETINAINMRISRVELHSKAEGWVRLSSTPRTFELLELNESGRSLLLADVEAEAGAYDQVKLTIDQVNVVTKDNTTREATLPANDMPITTTVVVSGNATTSVNFDFLADQSLHVATDGEYVFAPVVRTESRSGATITLGADSAVNISGGRVDSATTLGMDVDGSVKTNFVLDAATRLDIYGGAVLKLDALIK